MKGRRRRQASPPPTWSERFYVRIPAREIAYLKFIIEAYDNLAYVTVVDRYEAVLQVIFSPSDRDEVRELLLAMRQETGLEFVAEGLTSQPAVTLSQVG